MILQSTLIKTLHKPTTSLNGPFKVGPMVGQFREVLPHGESMTGMIDTYTVLVHRCSVCTRVVIFPFHKAAAENSARNWAGTSHLGRDPSRVRKKVSGCGQSSQCRRRPEGMGCSIVVGCHKDQFQETYRDKREHVFSLLVYILVTSKMGTDL